MEKKKGLIREFKEFVSRGNVLDMAVGVILATAFGKITASLVNDVLMPFIGWIFGSMDLSKLNIVLREAAVEGDTVVREAVVIGIGTFLSATIDFILIAFAVFVIIKLFNRARERVEAKKKREAAVAEEAPPAPTAEELLSQILEELKNKN